MSNATKFERFTVNLDPQMPGEKEIIDYLNAIPKARRQEMMRNLFRTGLMLERGQVSGFAGIPLQAGTARPAQKIEAVANVEAPSTAALGGVAAEAANKEDAPPIKPPSASLRGLMGTTQHRNRATAEAQ